MMKYRDFYRIFVMGHLSHYTKILITLQQKVINGFCKLYLEAQTRYLPKEQKYSWYFVS